MVCLKGDFGSNEFRNSSCEFVNLCVCPEGKDDPRSHTKQHEPRYFRLELDVPFQPEPQVIVLVKSGA